MIIPVSLKTICRLCKKEILASSMTDIQNHDCSTTGLSGYWLQMVDFHKPKRKFKKAPHVCIEDKC